MQGGPVVKREEGLSLTMDSKRKVTERQGHALLQRKMATLLIETQAAAHEEQLLQNSFHLQI